MALESEPPIDHQERVTAPSGDGTPGPAGGSNPPARWPSWIVVAAVLIPSTAALVVILSGRWWQPGGDEALISLRAWGSWDSPELVGPYSRYGWSHPGPALFWVLALPARLLGDAGRGAAVGAVVVNAAAAAAAVWLVRRRAGLGAAAATTAIVALLVVTDPDGIWSVWNPYVTLLPFLAFLAACWGVAERDAPALPVAVLAAAFCIESHVGYAAVTLGVFSVAAAMATISWWRDGRPRPGRRTQLVLGSTALASIVVAAPAVIDQVSGSGNLGQILDYFTAGGRESVGLGYSVGQMARQLAPWGPWAGGHEPVSTFGGFATTAPRWWLLVPIAAVATALVVAGRRRDATAIRLLVLASVAAVVGVWSVASITPPAYPYLFTWLRVVAAALWGAVALTLARAVGAWAARRSSSDDEDRSTLRTTSAIALAVLPMVAAATVIGGSALPHVSRARAAQALLPDALAAVPAGSEFTISSDQPYSRVVETLGSQLVQQGRHVLVDAAHELAWGAVAETGTPGPDVVQLELVVATPDQPFVLPAGWREIGRWVAPVGDDVDAMVLLERSGA